MNDKIANITDNSCKVPAKKSACPTVYHLNKRHPRMYMVQAKSVNFEFVLHGMLHGSYEGACFCF